MNYAICNETFKDWAWGDICQKVAKIGYTGLEVAPFTLNESAVNITADQRRDYRRIAEDCGLHIIGLHWLFVSPPGLYLNHADEGIRRKTVKYLKTLVDLCGDLGGTIMVLGSPKQRDHLPGGSMRETFLRTADSLAQVMPLCAERGVTICFEPLTPAETNFINSAAEAVTLLEQVNHPNLKLHLDVKAMFGGEILEMGDVIRANREWLRHVHANDPNLLGPGMGDLDFTPIAQALRDIHYQGWLSVEVFDYEPGPEQIARHSLDYLIKVFGD